MRRLTLVPGHGIERYNSDVVRDGWRAGEERPVDDQLFGYLTSTFPDAFVEVKAPGLDDPTTQVADRRQGDVRSASPIRGGADASSGQTTYAPARSSKPIVNTDAILSGKAPELVEEIEGGKHDDDAEALLSAESSGRKRATVIAALKARGKAHR